MPERKGGLAEQQGRESGLQTQTGTGPVSVVPSSFATLDTSLNLSEPHLQIRRDNVASLYELNLMLYVK